MTDTYTITLRERGGWFGRTHWQATLTFGIFYLGEHPFVTARTPERAIEKATKRIRRDAWKHLADPNPTIVVGPIA